MTRRGESLTPAEVLRLQQTAGNQVVLRLLHGLRRAAAVPARQEPPPDDNPPAQAPVPRPEVNEPEHDPHGPPPWQEQKPAPRAVVAEPSAEEVAPLREEASEPRRAPEPAVPPAEEPQAPDEPGRPPDWLLRVAERARRDGAEDIARAAEEIARRLGEQAAGHRGTPLSPAERMTQEAAALAGASDGRWWGRGRLWRRMWSWTCWGVTLGHWGGPWLVLSAADYARVPYWRRKDAAFVAEVVYRATGVVHRARPSRVERGRWHPFRPRDWADERVAIPAFEPVPSPAPGDVWAEGKRAGVVLGGAEDVWLGLAPEARVGEAWEVAAGLALVKLGPVVRYRRYTGAA
jgi:hypothetical protein